jgi:two-component system, response regulator, stage 0 sporulation protein F
MNPSVISADSAIYGQSAPRAIEDSSRLMAGNSAQAAILVVDDEPLIRWSLAESLAAAGYRVIQAGDAATALASIENGQPDGIGLVFLDLRLPDSNDLRVLEAIKRRKPECVVVLMTAYGAPGVTTAALGQGAARVIDKPFDLENMSRLAADLIGAP